MKRRLSRWSLVALLLLPMLGAQPWATGALASDNERTIILIDTSERMQVRSPLAPLWVRHLGRHYAIREHGTTPRLPGRNQDFRLSAAALAGSDLFIPTGFSGSATVSDQSGTREVSYDFDADELAAIERFVRDGGGLLVIPWPMGRPNNLDVLLARFGFELRREAPRTLAAPTASGQPPANAILPLAATLAGRDYALAASDWLYPLHAAPADATTIAAIDGHPLVAEARVGAGHVVYLGLPALSDGMGYNQLPFAADNPAFFLDLVARAADAPPLTAAEATQSTWELRAAGLAYALYKDAPRTRPAHAEWAANLLRSADEGERCDLGSGCVRWAITPEQRAFLEQRRAAQDELFRIHDQIERRVQDSAPLLAADLASLEQDYARAVAILADDRQQQQGFGGLYRQQGGAYPRYDFDDPRRGIVALLVILLIAALIFLLAFAVTEVIRRRRPSSPAT